jgi:hypothetical protein
MAFVGSFVVIALFVTLILRIIKLAEIKPNLVVFMALCSYNSFYLYTFCKHYYVYKISTIGVPLILFSPMVVQVYGHLLFPTIPRVYKNLMPIK